MTPLCFRVTHISRITLVLLWGVSTNAVAANPLVSLTALDGEPIGVVHVINVGDGIVWLGTDNGLYGLQGDSRFHYGPEITNFDHPVSDVKLDQNNNVWAATFGGGLFSIDHTNDFNFNLNESNGLVSNYIVRIEYIANRYIVIATVSGVQIFDTIEKQLFSLTKFFQHDFHIHQSDIAKLEDNSFFLLGASKSYIFDLETITYEQIELPNRVFSQSIYRVRYESPAAVWISTSNGTFLYDVKTKITTQYEFHDEINRSTNDFIQTEHNGILFAAQGIYQLDDSNSKIPLTNLLSPFLRSDTIGSVSSFARSNDGSILMGGRVFGLSWLPSTLESISYLNLQSKSTNARIGGVMNLGTSESLILHAGRLYNLPNFKRGEIKKLDHLKLPKLRSIVGANSFLYAVDTDDRLVSVSMNKSATNPLGSITISPMRHDKVSSIRSFGNRLISLNTDGQLFELVDDVLIPIVLGGFSGDVIFSSKDSFVAVDYFNRILLSNDMKNWLTLEHENLSDQIAIDCIEKTITGTIYFCTSGDGIVTIEPENTNIVASKLNKLIDSKYIRGIKSDNAGNLWIATNNGLYRAEQNGAWVQKVTQKEGVIDLDFESEGLHMSASSDHLLIEGHKLTYLIELNKFNLAFDEYLTKTNSVFVSRINSFSRVGEDPDSTALIQSTGSEYTVIDSDVYLTQISFAADNTVEHKYLEFEYRLLGLADEWKTATKGNASASFYGLEDGSYTFEVRAIDQRSLEEQPIASLNLRVLPPIWLTSEAIIFYFLSIILIYVAMMYWRRNLDDARNTEIDTLVNNKTAMLVQQHNATTESLKKKTTLISNLSHEMRTPITIILGWINNLRESGQFEKSTEKLVAIQQNSMQLKTLVDQLLELEGLDAKVDKPIKSHNIFNLLVLITEYFKPLTQEKFIEVIIKGNKKIKIAAIDGTLNKIFSNILSNAVKYTPEEGTICLCIKEKSGMAEVSVADSGDGISEGEQASIFNRFSRLQKHRGTAGSGIGLALVKELIVANAGSIAVSSEIGLGTTFTVLLPIASKPALGIDGSLDMKRLPLSANHNKPDIKPKRIVETEGVTNKHKAVLIIDDSEDVRTYLNAILSREYRCIRAINGREGFEIATNILPDAIISDVVMPLMDGLQLTRKLRCQDITSHIPIILVSAKGDDDSKMAGLLARADDYLIKPFNEKELILKVRQLISSRDSQADAYFEKHEEVLAAPNIAEAKMPGFENERDQRFYTTLLLTTYKHYSEESYSRDVAAKALNCSDRQLNRKLNALVDLNFTNFLKKFRLEQAKKRLLETGKVGNVAYDVGFASPSYFGACFKNEYDETPREYIDRNISKLKK